MRALCVTFYGQTQMVILIVDNQKGWNMNPRGAGYTFGADTVETFCQQIQVDLICRAHQLVMEGYKYDR
jgi:diadenosine tetraphosphatase ApaH/serine/threonine PP2A family protein phosphatase